jgi:hypothetical protein
MIRPNQTTILIALLKYHYLSLNQLRRLLRYGKSDDYLRGLCNDLKAQGYLAVEELPRPQPTTPSRRRGGSGQYVYKLTRPAHRYLDELGYDIPPRVRKYYSHTNNFLTHTVEASEVLLLCELFSYSHPQVNITAMHHDRDLQHLPENHVTIADPSGGTRTVTYSPDGYVNFEVTGTPAYESPVLFEVDRGSEHQRAWRTKLRSILAYNHGPHERVFGTDYLTVAVVTTAGFPRLEELHRWTFDELVETLKAPELDVKRFLLGSFALAPTTPDAQRPTPTDFVTGRRWYTLLSEQPVPLLEHID